LIYNKIRIFGVDIEHYQVKHTFNFGYLPKKYCFNFLVDRNNHKHVARSNTKKFTHYDNNNIRDNVRSLKDLLEELKKEINIEFLGPIYQLEANLSTWSHDQIMCSVEEDHYADY